MLSDIPAYLSRPLAGISVLEYLRDEYYIGLDWWFMNLCYAVILIVGSTAMHFRGKPFQLTTFPIIHNVFLCLLSLYMCLGACYYTLTTLSQAGLHTLYCDPVHRFDHGNWFISQIGVMFYLSKYYEFIDSFILVLRSSGFGNKSRLTVLHVWHHMTTSGMASMALNSHFGFFYVMNGILNGGIHVAMYYYYAVSGMYEYKPWWKKYLTQMQINQFITMEVISLVWLYYRYVIDDQCPGTILVFILGIVLVLSFIVLFRSFQRKNYSSSKNQKKVE